MYTNNKNTIKPRKVWWLIYFCGLVVLRTNTPIFPLPNYTEHRRTTSLSVKLTKCHKLNNPAKFRTKFTTNVSVPVLYGNVYWTYI